MAGVFKNLLGTIGAKFQIGLGGPNIKGTSGKVQARNAADSAFAIVEASLHATYGDDFELNSGATLAGADWKYSFRRPSTGMTHSLIVVYPNNDPAVGQALTVAGFVGDVITLQWTTVAGGADKLIIDTTTLGFGTTSPLAMFSKPANAEARNVRVIIDTPFNGTPSLSVGISGTLSKYMPSNAIDLTAPAMTVFEYDPGEMPTAGVEAIIATYAAGSASVGSARIEVSYVIPS
jgi:hypothetical protein